MIYTFLRQQIIAKYKWQFEFDNFYSETNATTGPEYHSHFIQEHMYWCLNINTMVTRKHKEYINSSHIINHENKQPLYGTGSLDKLVRNDENLI